MVNEAQRRTQVRLGRTERTYIQPVLPLFDYEIGKALQHSEEFEDKVLALGAFWKASTYTSLIDLTVNSVNPENVEPVRLAKSCQDANRR
jgi:hypothetical protein